MYSIQYMGYQKQNPPTLNRLRTEMSNNLWYLLLVIRIILSIYILASCYFIFVEVIYLQQLSKKINDPGYFKEAEIVDIIYLWTFLIWIILKYVGIIFMGIMAIRGKILSKTFDLIYYSALSILTLAGSFSVIFFQDYEGIFDYIPFLILCILTFLFAYYYEVEENWWDEIFGGYAGYRSNIYSQGKSNYYTNETQIQTQNTSYSLVSIFPNTYIQN